MNNRELEKLYYDLDDHLALINYMIYEISNTGEESIETVKHIYADILSLSRDRLRKQCIKLEKSIFSGN